MEKVREGEYVRVYVFVRQREKTLEKVRERVCVFVCVCERE